MKRLTEAIAFASLTFAASTAHAAVDFCRFVPYLPNYELTFEQSRAGLDSLGCEAHPSDSAHIKSWACGTGPDRVFITLAHLVRENMNLLLMSGEAVTGLDGFRVCPGPEMSAYRRAIEARRTQPSTFDPGSILIQDAIAVGEHRVPMTYLDLVGSGVIVVGWPSSSISQSGITNPIILGERIWFGVTHQAYESTQVVIAGQNLYTTPAPAIIAALQSRGSTITGTRDRTNGRLTITTLTAPVGLDGVTQVEIESLRRHTLSLTYHLSGETQYATYVGLLDGRYGRSTVHNGTAAINRTCRYRGWSSGAIEIVGEYCPNTGYVIVFNNRVTQDQLNQALEHSRRPARPAQPRIDPDNL